MSGRAHKRKIPQTKVINPKIMNSHCQAEVSVKERVQVDAAKPTLHGKRLSIICSTPYAIRAPKVFAIPFPRNHIPCRQACSDGLYHMLVSKLNPGLTVLSVTPSRTRRTHRATKFCAALWHARTTAQAILVRLFVPLAGNQERSFAYIVTLRNLPSGNLTNPREAG